MACLFSTSTARSRWVVRSCQRRFLRRSGRRALQSRVATSRVEANICKENRNDVVKHRLEQTGSRFWLGPFALSELRSGRQVGYAMEFNGSALVRQTMLD